MSAQICEFQGCQNESSLGTCLCQEHLKQCQPSQSKQAETEEKPSQLKTSEDSYDALVDEFTEVISNSSQMRNLTNSLMKDSVENAINSFPSLSAIPSNLIEQLMSFMVVNVVSSVIQDRSHLLARAYMLAESLHEEQARGIYVMIDLELESLKDHEEKLRNG
jgi:hypothetical protein